MNQQNALMLLIAEPSMTRVEMAKIVGTTTQAICRWLHNPIFRAEYEKQVEEGICVAKAMLGAQVENAVNTVVQAMDDKKIKNTQLQAACEILDRVGLVKQGIRQADTNYTIIVEDKIPSANNEDLRDPQVRRRMLEIGSVASDEKTNIIIESK